MKYLNRIYGGFFFPIDIIVVVGVGTPHDFEKSPTI